MSEKVFISLCIENFKNRSIFYSNQFNMEHTAICTLLYISGVLFNIVILLTTFHKII